MTETTIVYPKPGVTLYLPGAVHGFSGDVVGVALRSDHAAVLVNAGHLDTEATKKATKDLVSPQAETVSGAMAQPGAKLAAETPPPVAATPGSPSVR